MISGATRLYAVVGRPVTHSLSPLIHNALFRRFDLDARYVALPVKPAHCPTLLAALHRTSFDGLNVTTPHKVRVMKAATGLDPAAKAVGAANTLVRTTRGWRGVNTDGLGLCDYLQDELDIDLTESTVTILGAGPASRAAVFELVARDTKEVIVLNRSERRLQSPFFRGMHDRHGVRVGTTTGTAAEDALRSSSVVVNATSWGLGGHAAGTPPVRAALLRRATVVDMNYDRLGRPTPFLALLPDAKRGHDGRGMLRRQATRAFEIWTGISLSKRDHRALVRRLANLDTPRKA